MVRRWMGWLWVGLALLAPTLVQAAAVSSANVEARWLAEYASIQPGRAFRLGLRLDHAEHWHTYWKNPGDSGLGTTVDWSLPEGFRAEEIEYAAPQWIPSQGLVTFGHEGTVTHFFTIHPPADLPVGATVRLGGEVSWLECYEACLPGGGELFIELPVTETPGKANEELREAEAHLPWTPENWQASGRVEEDHLTITVQAPGTSGLPVDGMHFFPEAEGLVDLAAGIDVLPAEGGYKIRARLNAARASTPEVVDGVLVAAAPWPGSPGRLAAQIRAPLGADAAPGAGGAGGPGMGLASAMLAAFLGGIILNLMPCVFPVLSLKILGFVNLAGEDPAKVWRHGLLFAAGVLVSFWAVAGILLAVKAAVPAAGWGFQLKEPAVVISMCLLFFLLALNLFGVFEIGTSLTAIGSGATSAAGAWGSFLSGVLATVVATPCTGPFMGAAIGVALTQPPGWALAIFTFLGLGMAFPYLLLSRFPAWLKAIPRPGPWMESLKQFLGFLLMAFAMWLVWILNGLRGPEGLSRLLAGLLVVGFAAWVYGRWGSMGRRKPVRVAAIALALACLVGGADIALSRAPESPWQPYSPELVAALRDSSKPVFVDFTADWCVTCQANKKVALNTDRVQRAFRQHKVELVQANWTRQEERITRAMAEFGRSGVPLYLLYSPGGDAPRILPELLTPDIVIRALEEM